MGLLSAAEASAGTPETDYMIHCMGCHLADGSGAPAAGIPSFVDRVGYYLVIPDGRAYLAQVPGAADSPLDDTALAGVLNWMLREFGGESLPAEYEPLGAKEVGEHRDNRPTDIDAERRRFAVRIERLTEQP